ncbi:hypothetical protein D3C76_1104830 [compost metagenome]
MHGRCGGALAGNLRGAGEQAQQAQLQGLRPGAVAAHALEPGAESGQDMQVLDAAEGLHIGVPTVAGQAFAMGAVQVQARVGHVGHQRQRLEGFDAHAGVAIAHHGQGQARRLSFGLLAGGYQQPVGGIAGSDEILASGEAEVSEAGLHVRRAHAAVLGDAQGPEAQRRRWPEQAEGALVTGEEGQPRRGGELAAEHRQFEGRDLAQAIEQGTVPVVQGLAGRQAGCGFEQALPGHGGLLGGCHTSIMGPSRW